MLLTEHKAYLFAGAGITKESHVEHEALELDQKLNLMKSLLIN
jgi:anthranilate/para-aminobenzoate synthase component I